MFDFPFEYKIAAVTVVLVIIVYLIKLFTSKPPGPRRQTISIPPPRRKNRPKIPLREMSPEELIDETVAIAEEVRDTIMWARSPNRNPGEGNSRPVPKDIKTEDGPLKTRRNYIYSVIARLKAGDDLFREMHETARRFNEVFGEQFSRPLEIILNTKNQIISRTEALLQLDYAVKGDPRKEPNRRRPLEVTAGLRLTEDGIDPIAQRLEEALIPLRALQNTLRQKKGRSSRF